MKKRFTMLLAALLLLLPACGQGAAEGSTPPPSGAPALPAQTDAPSQPAGEPAPAFVPTATLEETVLVDEGDVKITATGLKYTAYEVKVSLTLENNTDKNLSFRSGTMGYSCNSVNGYMVDGGYLNADVAAGKKSNESVAFDIGELSILGLPDIADIELGFDIADDQHEAYLQTGPRQLKTSTADSYDYGADTYRAAILNGGLAKTLGFTVDCDFGEVQYDEKGVRVISQTLITNSSGEQALLVEVENTTGDTVFASVGDVAVNGLGVQSGTWSTDWVSPGKRRIVSMSLSTMLEDSQRAAFGLEQIGAVSYSFGFKDMDGDALVLPKTLTLSVPGGRSYDPSGEEIYQENGVRIVYKGLVLDDFEYSDDIHILLLAENGGDQPLSFDIDSNSVSVNGYMTSALCYSRTVSPGGSAILDVELADYSLEENGIAGLVDIAEVELTFEIRDGNYKTVAEPTVTFAGKLAIQWRQTDCDCDIRSSQQIRAAYLRVGGPLQQAIKVETQVFLCYTLIRRYGFIDKGGREMGRLSTKENKTPYQIAREELGLSREKASELLESIPPERIEKIESEKSPPRADEVLIMAGKYKKPTLCNHYCSQQCPTCTYDSVHCVPY